ncbi:MAG: amidohydrolase [Bacteroidetes bacterium]|nr:MAG: amidohydrolase [Bacteroidota bacterium]
MDQLNISLVQADLVWEDPVRNREKLDHLIDQLTLPTDIVVLPELFTSGFSMNAAPLAEPPGGTTSLWLKAKARQLDAAVVGSIITEEDGKFYNRLWWVLPDGQVHTYDKRHLFTLASEDQVYTAGQQRLVVDFRGWRILPLICYDLRFPVWSRNDLAYDLLLYVANFPDRRGHAWRSLLLARAIENQAYTVGLNRVGTDGNGAYYAGDSAVIDYAGHYCTHLPAREMVAQVVLSKASQDQFRAKFAFLADQDRFIIDGSTTPRKR